MKRTLSAGQVINELATSYGYLTKLVNLGLLERDTSGKNFRYNLEEVRFAINERRRQREVQSAERTQEMLEKRLARKKAAAAQSGRGNWSKDGVHEALPAPVVNHISDEDRGRFYPPTGGSAIAHFAGVRR